MEEEKEKGREAGTEKVRLKKKEEEKLCSDISC